MQKYRKWCAIERENVFALDIYWHENVTDEWTRLIDGLHCGERLFPFLSWSTLPFIDSHSAIICLHVLRQDTKFIIIFIYCPEVKREIVKGNEEEVRAQEAETFA